VTIEISNVGPIEHVTIPVPDGGGVTVLRGPNGGGKSTAIDAVSALAGRRSDLSVRARRGSDRGSVSGLGATISVGKAKATPKGQLEISVFDPRFSLADLVDPGVKDPEAADRRRIATACGLAGIEVDADKFRVLAEDLDEGILSGELVDVAGAVKAELHSRARDRERRGLELAERARTLADEAGQVEGAPSVEDAQLALEQAIAQQSALRARAEAADEAAERAENAREALDRLGDHGADLGALSEAKVNADRDCVVAEAKVDDLRRLLAEAQQGFKDAGSRAIQAGRDLESARRAANDRESARKALEDATAVAGAPTGDDMTAAHHKVQECREALALASTAERAAGQREQAKQAESEAIEETKAAAALRESAAETDDVLAEHLAAVMPQGLRVVDGRLFIERDGRPIPFSELSDGERWTIALDIGIEAVGSGGLMAIEQPAWEGLDTSARNAIHEHAKARGVTVLAAEADHGEVVGPLRGEVFAG